MYQQEQLEDLKHIRSIMERSSRFLTLSGFSGIFAGVAALLGVAVFYNHFNLNITSNNFYEIAKNANGEIDANFLKFIVLDVSLVLISSIAVAFIMTIKKAKQHNQPLWDATAKRLMFNLMFPLFVGAIFCLILFYHGYIKMIAPTTLLFYGMALLNASKYTLTYVRYLGIGQMLIGLLAAFFIDYGIAFWAVGFGVLHIFYGIVMYLKIDK